MALGREWVIDNFPKRQEHVVSRNKWGFRDINCQSQHARETSRRYSLTTCAYKEFAHFLWLLPTVGAAFPRKQTQKWRVQNYICQFHVSCNFMSGLSCPIVLQHGKVKSWEMEDRQTKRTSKLFQVAHVFSLLQWKIAPLGISIWHVLFKDLSLTAGHGNTDLFQGKVSIQHLK